MNGKPIAVRTLIQASVVAFVALTVLLILRAAEVFLVVFGGILFAILFHGTAKWLQPEDWPAREMGALPVAGCAVGPSGPGGLAGRARYFSSGRRAR